MQRNVRIHKSPLMSHVSHKKEVKHLLREQPSEVSNHDEMREPVKSIEHAMDIAIGAEPWFERKKAA